MTKYYVDVGSGTVKTYSASDGHLDLVKEKSLFFKEGFDQITGVSPAKIDALVEHLLSLNLPNDTKTFATGIWREIPDSQVQDIRSEFVHRLGFDFNIITHEQEGAYLKRASELNYGGKKVLVINMGGKTTELVTYRRDGTTTTQLLRIGVADINAAFPEINESVAAVELNRIEDFCASKISDVNFDTDYDFALFTGELRFEKMSGYPLEKNTMFDDANHPFQVSLIGFIAGTMRIFFEMTMDDLRALMPDNPKWMDGARAGAVLPLAVFRKTKIETIIPSDINLINGVIEK